MARDVSMEMVFLFVVLDFLFFFRSGIYGFGQRIVELLHDAIEYSE
jgi:hypothetical protein